ncbi:MAG: folylpolyglutamate synthase/dihydrofolate synthase family protein [Planctomycetota bacterium]
MKKTTKRRSPAVSAAGAAKKSGKSTPKKSAAKPAAKAKTSATKSAVRKTAKRRTSAVARRTAGEPITTLPRALKFLAGLSDVERSRIVRYDERTFDLQRMVDLLDDVGNPHEKIRTIHIAGTKGKGSTATMIAAMLRANGMRVGVYSSPHLIDIRERFTIATPTSPGEMISQAEFTRLVAQVAPHCENGRGRVSYFDALTAVAFLFFASQEVDIAVIETGLGGRLDSTNVVTPLVSAITGISIDHTAQLGNTLAKIATEKAGIFKPGVPAVSVPQDDEAKRALRRVAKEKGVELAVLGDELDFSYRFAASRTLGVDPPAKHNYLCLHTPHSDFEHFPVPLVGEHQALNCALALAVIDQLKQLGFALDDQRAMDAMDSVELPGRMQIIHPAPRIIVDCAHNAASIDTVLRAIGQHVTYDSLVTIFGCCSDKDIDGMLAKLACGADKVIFCGIDSVRGANPHDLAKRYQEKFGKVCQVADDLHGAMSIARRAVAKEDLICITGSFYLVGEAIRAADEDTLVV